MIIKIGGSVLKNIDALEIAAKKMAAQIKQSSTIPIIIISAFKNSTNELLRMVLRFSNEFSNENIDVQMNKYNEMNSELSFNSFVLTTGEQITAGLFALALEKEGVNALPFASWQIPIILENNNLHIEKKIIQKCIDNQVVPIVTGYQAIDKKNNIKDLGRGGSDLTAIAFAQTFNQVCVLIKNSGGICAADPDLISSAFSWPELSYDNALAIANAGSRVIQSQALELAKAANVVLKVTNLDFQDYTLINNIDKPFWSIFEYKHKLRLVTNKKADFVKEHNFNLCENISNSYEFNRSYFDMKSEADKIYHLCKKRLS